MPIEFDLSHYHNDVFIETGFGSGDGVQKAIEAGIEKIFSIEIDKDIYQQGLKKFSREIAAGKVILVHDDAAHKLADIISSINSPITFWLDAHSFSKSSGEKKCSLISELSAIANHKIKTHTILIDDDRIFGRPKSWGENIKKEDILSKLRQINNQYSIFYEKGMIPADVIVASLNCSLFQKLRSIKMRIHGAVNKLIHRIFTHFKTLLF